MIEMKEGCTKFTGKRWDIIKNSVTLPKSSRPYADTGETRFLCTRTDSDVQEVESGSSTLMMTERSLSELTPCSGVDSSFMFSSSSGFARTLLSGNVSGSPHRLFSSPCALKNTGKNKRLNI